MLSFDDRDLRSLQAAMFTKVYVDTSWVREQVLRCGLYACIFHHRCILEFVCSSMCVSVKAFLHAHAGVCRYLHIYTHTHMNTNRNMHTTR